MSFKLLVHAWEAEVPTQSHRLVLMKLVDCCDDDGRNIFPKISTVSKSAKCSDRHVQRVVGEFCRIGLLRRIRVGGQGRASAAHYEMDIDMLVRLRRAEMYSALLAAAQFDPIGEDGENDNSHAPDACEGESEDPVSASSKGDRESPLAGDRVTPATPKGDKLSHPHSITPQESLKTERERVRAPERRPAHLAEAEPRHAAKAGQAEDGQPSISEPVPTFEDFLEAYPHAKGDNRVQLRSAWADLPFDQRRLAIGGIEAFLAERKAGGLKGRLSGPAYLAGRCWIGLEGRTAERAAAVQAGAPRVVPAWSREWWLLLLDRVATGRNPQFWVSRGVDGKASTGTTAEIATATGRIGALHAYRCHGPEIEAWRGWLAGKGARIPAFNGDFRVFLPGPLPPGVPKDREDDDVQF